MIKNRIDSFVKLGNTLKAYISEYKDEQAEQENPLAQLIKDHYQFNAWFTPRFVLQSIENILPLLTEEVLQKYLEAYQISEDYTDKRIGVITAGNIPLVEFHDFLSVVISGHRFVGKLSSKNKHLLPLIKEILERIDVKLASQIRILDEGEFLKDVDAVIATGSNNSARYFEYYFNKYPHIIRKNRKSVAVISENDTENDLRALAKDIFMYFGLGCRNVSKLFLPKGFSIEKLIPLFSDYSFLADHSSYMNNYSYHKAIHLMDSIPFYDAGFFMLKEDTSFASPLSMIHYSFYTDIESVKQRLAIDKDQLQCVLSSLAVFDNIIPFGQSQSPGLFDFADGVDTMAFLNSL